MGIMKRLLSSIAALRFAWAMAALLSPVCLSSAAEQQDEAQTATKTKARILLVTGIDYPGHLWRQTAPVLAEALRKYPRLEVVTIEDPQFLESAALQNYDEVLMH